MATWQPGNGGSFLAGIGGTNSNAPRAGDVNTAAELIRDNNNFARSGGNNVMLQGLQGLKSLADVYQQDKLQQAQSAFDKAHADAWASGDATGLVKFAQENPAFVAQAQQAFNGIGEQHRKEIGDQAVGLNMALAQGGDSFKQYISSNQEQLKRIGADPNTLLNMGLSDPQQFSRMASVMAMGSLGADGMLQAQDRLAGRQIQRDQLAETARNNDMTNARGIRGQNISAATARRGQDLMMQRASARGGIPGARQVQLADGRTISISGNVHGQGSSAFYEGVDDAGNIVRVPASSVAAPATSAANAQNYAMEKDINALLNANSDELDFMTGVTGGSGNPAVGADYRSRWNGAEQRQLYNASRRIQGRMQNQGVAAARDMGASGINTVAEAKMYFQGMPQIDYSSPKAMQDSLQDIQQYTNNYNQQYNVNVGGTSPASTQQQPVVHTSKSGITFQVE